MIQTGDLVAIAGLAACLILAAAGLRTNRVGSRRLLMMGVIWAVAIAALAAILQFSGV